MAVKRLKRPRDPVQLGKMIGDILTGQIEDKPQPGSLPHNQKNPAAVALGKLGGSKGGMARAGKLSPERRTEIAKKAAEKRWKR